MREHDFGLTSISRRDWSYDRRGERDSERHKEKVKEAIRDNLGDLINDGSIITADPHTKKTIKVPIKSLELPDFRYGDLEGGVGSGDGSEQDGDLVDGDGEGDPSKPGDKPGEEYYETELDIEEIQALVFEDLGLPNIKPKSKDEMVSDEVVFNDIRANKSGANMDINRTIMQSITRQAMGDVVRHIIPEDFRVRSWEEEKKPTNNAVVIAMADISGSMGEFEKYVTRSFCWWAVSFLKTKYPNVDIVFVAHDTEAYEVTEEQFFSRGAGGGTKCSSANEIALDITQNRYPTSNYNVYPLHFSDGDNWRNDNEKCINLVQQLLDEDINQYAYVQIGARSSSGLIDDYQTNIHDNRFNGIVIKDKEDVLDALKAVFNPDKEM